MAQTRSKRISEQHIDNLEQIEAAGKALVVESGDLWGIKESSNGSANGRKLEKVQPTLTYSKALLARPEIQHELYSIFEFARADFQSLRPIKIFSFMGRKLEHLIDFDAAVFYEADLRRWPAPGRPLVSYRVAHAAG